MRRTKKVPKARNVLTLDGWENVYTGLGQAERDKRRGSAFQAEVITQDVAQDLWQGDDILARAVETPADEMLREGFNVKIEGDRDLSEELDNEHVRLGTEAIAMEALNYARAFGGAGIIAGPLDGSVDLEKPLKEERIFQLDALSVRSPLELVPERWYADAMDIRRYGTVSKYRLCPLDTPPGGTSDLPLIHESRIIRVDGVKTSRYARFRTNAHPGWDDSIFVRIAQIAADFQHAWQGAAILLQDFATPTLKMKHLAQVLGSKNGAERMADRAAAVEMCRSIARVVIVDADNEDYKRETVTVTGLAEMLDKLSVRLSSALGWPVTFVMGQAPTGLNATGASDIRIFYDKMKAMQRRVLRPLLVALTRWMLFAKKGPNKGRNPDEMKWSITFPPLWQLTDLEKADLRYKQAQVDDLEIKNEIVTPEEVAVSRHGADGYSTETVIDLELREQMMADAKKQQDRLEQSTKETEAKAKALENPEAPEEEAEDDAPPGK
jgi:phage-related protein (TIGR01555 family)